MPPTKPASAPRFLVIGAGSRGNAYAGAVTKATTAVIHAVADVDTFKRQDLGRKYIWGDDGVPGEGQEFSGWKEWLEWEMARREKVKQGHSTTAIPAGVDGVFVCTLDEMHIEILLAIAPLGLHILCEKPLATSLGDCLAISRAFEEHALTQSKIFSIGHVLRYSPHNRMLRKLLLEDRVIGEIISVEHTEPVGWYHFSHSYVRGNWRRETAGGDGSLLTKCSHDIDFLMWLLSSPPPGAPHDQPHHAPQSISSVGSLTQFRRSRKPAGAGAATNCLSCPAEKECIYSAVKIYKDRFLAKGKTGWPVKIVCPDIEDTFKTSGMAAAETQLMSALAEDYDKNVVPDAEIAARPWFGRCVYEADNNVVEDQVVTISWADDPLPDTSLAMSARLHGRGAKTATLHMIAPTQSQCDRRGRVYGTLGELSYDSKTISYYDFGSMETVTVEIPETPPDEEESHGGGDFGLTRAFVSAVEAVVNEGWEVGRAQREFVGTSFEGAVRSHAVVFAAEEARREGSVVGWKGWWEGKMGGK
ncbi:hypothetical protein FQN55_002547 [Onygenales sp. PD_40]|nr:hypothetical protein FQN55_002547 [Onygenales sp. PD_40]